MSLGLAASVFHGAVCVLLIVNTFIHRRSTNQQAAHSLTAVWCVWFVLARIRDVVAAELPPPGPAPLSGLVDRTLLALDTAAYFAWPALILGWVRWSFRGSRPLPVVIAWLAAWALPTAVYPAIRGAAWFRYAGAIHLAALAGEVIVIAQWIRRREAPKVAHVVALAAVPICAIPAIPFLASAEARAGYLVWVLRGLVALHLWVIAVVGGDLWRRLSHGSSRSASSS